MTRSPSQKIVSEVAATKDMTISLTRLSLLKLILENPDPSTGMFSVSFSPLFPINDQSDARASLSSSMLLFATPVGPMLAIAHR